MTINVNKRLFVSLCFTLISTFLCSYEVLAQAMPPILAEQDFSKQIRDKSVALGDRWTPDIARKIDVPVEEEVTGEVPFDGIWAAGVENDSSLTLRLAESGNRITGSYCYISQKGNRIDCPEDDERNLSGTIAGNHANVEFNSSFGGVGGQAVLEIKGSEMEWRLVTSPQNGNYYAPLRYTLRKAASVQNAETRKLDTDKFAVSLINKCGHFESECDQMVYLGVRKGDNSTISLMGKTLRDSAGKIIGSTYSNGGIVYTVTYAPAKLVVSKGNHVLVEQSGQWLK
ncbi:hypothetical protein [Enterobacter sp. GD03975]|uniref:hypothetical protein n=1 Tax=Enterobacter sp. GD03975 TaxID=2975412 RepID=UPI00244AAE0B|nr:hypothetical protein [Enterobacter sp. GD03975]MDH1124917.1 hypothetical protein [Enterobacter sp. GD03975]